jgi:hypothetical protein
MADLTISTPSEMKIVNRSSLHSGHNDLRPTRDTRSHPGLPWRPASHRDARQSAKTIRLGSSFTCVQPPTRSEATSDADMDRAARAPGLSFTCALAVARTQPCPTCCPAAVREWLMSVPSSVIRVHAVLSFTQARYITSEPDPGAAGFVLELAHPSH